MASGLSLQDELMELTQPYKVYYQPPSEDRMEYPCTLYTLAKKSTRSANNKKYIIRNRYNVKFITDDPDTEMPDKILKHFNHIEFDRVYKADNLYHFVFNLYY